MKHFDIIVIVQITTIKLLEYLIPINIMLSR